MKDFQDAQTPHIVEAEQQLLGAMLIHPEIGAHVTPDLFYDPVHADLCRAIRKRAAEGLLVSPVALKRFADDHEGMKELGGARYLVRLAGGSVSASQWQSYADLLADMRDRRAMIELLDAARDDLHGEVPVADIAARVEAALSAQAPSAARAPVSMIKAVTGAMAEAKAAYEGGEVRALHTGIGALDRILGGLHPGDLCILAGRPSMGKSAVALQIAMHIARAGRGVTIASLEMTPEAMAYRALSEATTQHRNAVRYSDMRRGEMTAPQMETLVAAARETAELPIQFLPVEYRDLDALYAGARKSAVLIGEKCGLQLLIVDYLQLLRAPGKSRYEQITEISIALKGLAQRLGIPVIALSQLSREVDRREDNRPILSDIRESGQLEQDADQVVFCYRDEYYLEREEPDAADLERHERWAQAMERSRNRLELIVAKNRGGPIGTAHVMFNPALNKVWENG